MVLMRSYESLYNIYIYIFLTLAFFFVGADTMKLNKSRLRQLALSGEVAAAPVNLKGKKVDEGSSKRAEEELSRPSVQAAVPPSIRFCPSLWWT